jgi:hypothetical protein
VLLTCVLPARVAALPEHAEAPLDTRPYDGPGGIANIAQSEQDFWRYRS